MTHSTWVTAYSTRSVAVAMCGACTKEASEAKR